MSYFQNVKNEQYPFLPMVTAILDSISMSALPKLIMITLPWVCGPYLHGGGGGGGKTGCHWLKETCECFGLLSENFRMILSLHSNQ